MPSFLEWLGSVVDFASALKTGFGVVLGAVVASTVYRKAAKQQRENLIKSHNFSALSALTHSSSHAAAYSKVMRFAASRNEKEIPVSAISGNDDLEENILIMLAMYQFMAFAANQGLMDRELICQQFLPSMRTVVTRFRPMIEHYRIALNRPTVWSELEIFAREDA